MQTNDQFPPTQQSDDPLMRVQQARREAAESTRPMTDVELERWREEFEEKQYRKYMAKAVQNLLLWVVAVVGAALTAWDALMHIFSKGPK